MKPGPPESGLNVPHPGWGRRQQNTPRLPTWQDPQVQAPLSDPPIPFLSAGGREIQKPWPSLSGSAFPEADYKGQRSPVPSEDKAKHLPHGRPRWVSLARLQVITLAQIRSPSGRWASRFPIISFLRFELKQPQCPHLAASSLWSLLRRSKCLGLLESLGTLRALDAGKKQSTS